VEISTRAYCKIMMHCAKYPSSSINGVLLARKNELKSGKPLKICDSIPLFHMGIGLTPMLEVALSQIEKEVESSGLMLAGFYHAHDNIKDNHVDVFTGKIADKMVDNQPGSILLTVDSKRLSSSFNSTGLILRVNTDGKWKVAEDKVKLEHDAITLKCASKLVNKRMFREIVDFDAHLDDLTQDYLNVGINMKIDSCLL